LRQCVCGNFANPLLNGSCNTCNSEHQRKLWEYVFPVSHLAASAASWNGPYSSQLSSHVPSPSATHLVGNVPSPSVAHTASSSQMHLDNEIAVLSGSDLLSKFVSESQPAYLASAGSCDARSLGKHLAGESKKAGLTREVHDKSSDESTKLESHQRSSSEESPSSQDSNLTKLESPQRSSSERSPSIQRLNLKRPSGHTSRRQRSNSASFRKRPRSTSAGASRSSSFRDGAGDRFKSSKDTSHNPNANSSAGSSASAEKALQRRGPRNALFCG
jgi:hypothetical protein